MGCSIHFLGHNLAGAHVPYKWYSFSRAFKKERKSVNHQTAHHLSIYHKNNSESNCWQSIWTTSWENLFMQYANNKGADQPAHSCSLISTFVVCCLDSIIPLVSKSQITSLYLDSVPAQADSSLAWSETPKIGFSHDRQYNHGIDFAGIALFKASAAIVTVPISCMSPVMRKPFFKVFDQVRHKPVCAATQAR